MYQNHKFTNQHTGKFVNVSGPALFHVCQDETQFLFFCNTLLEARFVGLDCDKEQKGFLKPLTRATYLPCKKHIQDSIKKKLQNLQLDGCE